MARFFVDGTEVDETEYGAKHEELFGVPPQDTSGTGFLFIGDPPEESYQYGPVPE